MDLAETTFDKIINLCQIPYISHLMPLLNAHSVVGQQMLPEGNHAIEDLWSLYLYAIPFARRYNSFHAVDLYRRIADVSHHEGYHINLTDEEKENKYCGYEYNHMVEHVRKTLKNIDKIVPNYKGQGYENPAIPRFLSECHPGLIHTTRLSNRLPH